MLRRCDSFLSDSTTNRTTHNRVDRDRDNGRFLIRWRTLHEGRAFGKRLWQETAVA